MDLGSLKKKYYDVLGGVQQGLSTLATADLNPIKSGTQSIQTWQQKPSNQLLSQINNWKPQVRPVSSPSKINLNPQRSNPLTNLYNVGRMQLGANFRSFVNQTGANRAAITHAIKTGKANTVNVGNPFIPIEQRLGIKPVDYSNMAMNVGGLTAGLTASTGAGKLPTFSSLIDKKIRFEISDRQAVIKNKGLREAYKIGVARLEDIFDHKGLYNKYPQFKRLRVVFEEGGSGAGGMVGSFNPETFTVTIDPRQAQGQIRSTLLHEVQHAIQEVEGFASGTSSKLSGNIGYLRNAGELEASAAQRREAMSPAARLRSDPFAAEAKARFGRANPADFTVTKDGKIQFAQAPANATTIPKTPLLESKPIQSTPSKISNPAVSHTNQPSPISVAQPSIDPVQKIVQALKEAKPLRGAQEAMYRKARSQKYAKMMGTRERIGGEKGFFAEKGALKGELPKAQFESLRQSLTQPDIDTLFNKANDANLGEWEKLTVKTGLSKVLEGAIPTRNEIKLLDEVYGPEFTKALLDKRSFMQKAMATLGDVLNIPKTLMSSIDLSAPLRQGVFLVGRPKQWVPAFGEMIKSFSSQKAYQSVMDEISSRPTYKIMRENKLALTQANSKLAQGEEAFMSNVAERIPGIGHLVKASERAYTGFLNKIRADVFDDIVRSGQNIGLGDDPAFLKSAADFVNAATGRGNLPSGVEGAAQALNGLFFSPRLMASRLTLLNPVSYVRMQPQVRKEALKSLFTFAGTGLTVLGLAKLAGADVENDPRSADFGKIKIGNTRYDIWGGFQQYIRAAAQMITGQKINTVTGQLQTLGENYRSPTRKDILTSFLESKEAPIAAFVTKLFEGKDPAGNPYNIPAELLSTIIPMSIQDMYDLQKEWGPKGYLMGIPGLFGVGSQTYGKQIPTIGTTEAGNPTIKLKPIPGMAEDIVNKITGTPVSNIPQEQQQQFIDAKKKEQDLSILRKNIKIGGVTGEAKPTTYTIDGTDYDGYELNGKFVYVNEDGETKTKSVSSLEKDRAKDEKGLFEAKYSLVSDRLKRAEDYQTWNTTTQAYVDYLTDYKTKLDENKDAKELITVQNKIEDLQDTLNKYKSYGGFSKPKKPKKVALKIKPIKVSIPKAKKIKVKKVRRKRRPVAKIKVKKVV